MLDVLDLPNSFGGADVQVFTRPTVTTNKDFSTWIKPRGKTMLWMLCVGGGGGGGGGFTRAAGNAGAGGGGGGGSAQARLTIAACCVPDVLWIQVGAGGVGKSSGGGTAGSGILSYVSIMPDVGNALNIVLKSGAAAAVGGGTGTGTTAGAAGTAGTINTIAGSPLAGNGIYQFIAGQVGIIGGAAAGAVGGDQSLPTTGVTCMGGAGGAGTTSADFHGGCNGPGGVSAMQLLAQYGGATPVAGSVDGAGGYLLGPPSAPWWSFSGQGGGASNSGIGGNGGYGGPGSGGGGGGAGTTGGRGGDGGSGIVIIVAW